MNSCNELFSESSVLNHPPPRPTFPPLFFCLYRTLVVSWELSYVQGVTFADTLVVLITPLYVP